VPLGCLIQLAEVRLLTDENADPQYSQ
jgi:hypothetical protein